MSDNRNLRRPASQKVSTVALVKERHADLAARQTKTLATAEKLLKRYIETLALLTGRHEQQTRILHVHTQGDVAVQVNQGVEPPQPEV